MQHGTRSDLLDVSFGGGAGAGPVPGKRTLTMGLPPGPVQRRATRDAAAGDIHRAAAAGLAAPTTTLPHAAAIQASFGDVFDLGAITAHVGGAAADACDAMGAAAYATGGHVAFAAAPDLHTAAHEAAHVVQQAHGVHLYGGVGELGDAHERHADAVADRVVAGQSAADLLWGLPGMAPQLSTVIAGPGAPVQRKMTFQDQELPSTWKQIGKKLPSARATAQQVFDAARTKIGDGADDEKLEKIWNKLAKDATVYDLETEQDDLVRALVAKYRRSQTASEQFRKRQAGQGAITKDLRAEHDDLKQTASARNPQLVKKDMAEFEFDSDTLAHEREQTHLATVLLDKYQGVESQTALARDKSSVVVSTNLDQSNRRIAEELRDAPGIEQLLREVAIEHKLASRDREQAMKDRVLRHAMKLFDRLKTVLDPDATVEVPSEEPTFDGEHAEIRIEKSEAWSRVTHFIPSGTKYPCMGCTLYFNDNGYPVSLRMGPMWISDSALATQLEPYHLEGERLATLDDDEATEASRALADQYDRLPDDVEMGYSRLKDGSLTTNHVPDSDSELDDSEFEQVKEKMLSTPKAKAKAKRKFKPKLGSKKKKKGSS